MLLGSRLGAQFKAIVEYAPSQRVPKPCSREGSREDNIFKGNFFIMKKKLRILLGGSVVAFTNTLKLLNFKGM